MTTLVYLAAIRHSSCANSHAFYTEVRKTVNCLMQEFKQAFRTEERRVLPSNCISGKLDDKSNVKCMTCDAGVCYRDSHMRK